MPRGWISSLIVAVFCGVSQSEEIDFNRDVRPILSDKCYACHGPDEGQRQADLRLDTREGAFADGSENAVVVPGNPAASEMIRRIAHSPDDPMPPAEHPKRLTAAEIATLVEWVRAGAEWKTHWAYVPPIRVAPISVDAVPVDAARAEHRQQPYGGESAAIGNFIDDFVLAKLREQDLKFSPPADRRTLLRRLSFDLVGLPPSAEEVSSFLSDKSPDAYEKQVDRLLRSPHFGERLAMYWLDLVRYADSVGYHGDQDVSVSPYRDYVIEAFNSNMPFDQFTREQLAGDLLENSTRDQLIASGYNKLGMMSAEGGVQPEEYLVKYAADRVRTASTVWLGSTLGCAECHDHKFDPFSSKDFYRFAAFFADIKERGLYSGPDTDERWGPVVRIEDADYAALIEPVEKRLAALQSELSANSPQRQTLQRQWETQVAEPSGSQDSENVANRSDKSDKSKELSPKVLEAVSVDEAGRTPEQQELVREAYLANAPELESLRKAIASAEELKGQIVREHTRTSLITEAVEPREIRVLPRGDWMSKAGEVVSPGTPNFLPAIQVEGRATRLDLANWLVDPRNPLTARVFVNRLWKLAFGTGLSKTLDDLGSQGEPPTHPELLDALAIEFVESGWDVKHMMKLIVMSRTYQQTSIASPELVRLDPYNRLLARQSRFRIEAEMIRDNALAVGDLLVRTVGGRSVKPYQPQGLYRHLNFPTRTYVSDTGASQYRRGVYTHWQRQFLHPAMQAFDAPAREECTAERPRSNTPLAALVLLNDPSYVEAARRFAENIILQGGETTEERLLWMFSRALSRKATEEEKAVLRELLDSEHANYSRHPDEAATLLAIGQSVPNSELDATELAAWTAVTRAVLNMHELVTRN